MVSASSSGIVKPYSCCMASWISTNASESRPIDSNVASGSSTTSSSFKPDPLDENPLDVIEGERLSCHQLLLYASGHGYGLRPGQGLEGRELLLRRSPARHQEQVREMEVPPARRAETRSDGHVGQVGVPDARVELRQIHHLEQRLQHARAPLRPARAAAGPRPATPRSVPGSCRLTETVTSAPSASTASRRDRDERQPVHQPVAVPLVRREHAGQRRRREQGLPDRPVPQRRRAHGRSGPRPSSTSGIPVSSNERSPVVSRKMRLIVSRPVDSPASESLKTSATASGVNASRSVGVDLGGAHPERHVGAHDRADAAAAYVVDGVAGLLEHLQRAHVGVALRAARAEREPELRAATGGGRARRSHPAADRPGRGHRRGRPPAQGAGCRSRPGARRRRSLDAHELDQPVRGRQRGGGLAVLLPQQDDRPSTCSRSSGSWASWRPAARTTVDCRAAASSSRASASARAGPASSDSTGRTLAACAAATTAGMADASDGPATTPPPRRGGRARPGAWSRPRAGHSECASGSRGWPGTWRSVPLKSSSPSSSAEVGTAALTVAGRGSPVTREVAPNTSPAAASRPAAPRRRPIASSAPRRPARRRAGGPARRAPRTCSRPAAPSRQITACAGKSWKRIDAATVTSSAGPSPSNSGTPSSAETGTATPSKEAAFLIQGADPLRFPLLASAARSGFPEGRSGSSGSTLIAYGSL